MLKYNRLVFFFLLIKPLSVLYAQRLSLDTFIQFPALASNTIFIENEYSNFDLNANSIAFIKKKNNDSVSLKQYKIDIKNLNLDSININFVPRTLIANLRHYNTSIITAISDKRMIIGSFNSIYIYKLKKSKNSYHLIKQIEGPFFSCNEAINLHKAKINLAHKVQPKISRNGGFLITKIKLKNKNIIRRDTLNRVESIFTYYDKNYNYVQLLRNNTYLSSPLSNNIVKYNRNSEIIDTILQLRRDPAKELINFEKIMLLNEGKMSLLDTIDFISNHYSRIMNFYIGRQEAIAIASFVENDSTSLQGFLINNGQSKKLDASQLELKIISQSKYILAHHKIYCFTSFGNINYFDKTLTEDDIFLAAINEKPILGLYVFEINN